MKTMTIITMLILISIPMVAQNCGTERWPVKTLADDDVAQVKFSPLTSGDIRVLVAQPAPSRKELEAAQKTRYPLEKRAWEVDAVVIGFKLEADGDFHIVLASPSDHKATMVAEIPDPGCVPEKYGPQFADLRKWFVHQFGSVTEKYKTLPKPAPVTVTGVGFLDYIHGQTGVARNGFELHPILTIKRNGQ